MPALVALDKPAGWPTHPLRRGETGTLASALVARFPECATASPDRREAGFVHRLDAGTSGVIVAARDPDSWQALRRIVGGERCEKIYLAEVVPPPAPMARWDRQRRWSRRPSGGWGGGRGRCAWGRGAGCCRRAPRSRSASGGSAAWLVEARLHRGRAHQVRAHLAHLGMPVLGDPLYGDAARARAGGGAGGHRVSPARLADPPGPPGTPAPRWRSRRRHPTGPGA